MADLPRILVVDDSRLVRASLSHHLKGVYDVREEVDGEAAWQTLVLDHSIQAVISDLQMPKLDGVQLLERVRASRLRRLQQIPSSWFPAKRARTSGLAPVRSGCPILSARGQVAPRYCCA